MKDNKIEAKLDVFRKQQENITKVGFSIQHADIPDHLAAAALGKRYYIVLIDADYYDDTEGGATAAESATDVSKTENTEGNRIRVRAVMLCKEGVFQVFCRWELSYGYEYRTQEQIESATKLSIYKYCNIKSRSELTTNKSAQEKFKQLDQQFKDWSRYEDNLSRE